MNLFLQVFRHRCHGHHEDPLRVERVFRKGAKRRLYVESGRSIIIFFNLHVFHFHFTFQQWSRDHKKTSILCHNFPYDIYSIKGSCGPHPQTCLEFNFRKVSGDFNEYTARSIPITASNVKERSELILEQYGKTGSLFPHNVVLVPLGDDFTYDHEEEWDQQYTNYKMIMDFINQGRLITFKKLHLV